MRRSRPMLSQTPPDPVQLELVDTQHCFPATCANLGTDVMFGNIGGLISTWSFLPFDAPNYHIGNGLNLATASMTLLTAVLLLLWMNWDNKRRDKKDIDEMLTGLNPKQVQDLDWRHPAFRWRP